ncbi:MAG: MvaI/BcnI family restriction endonuclease [Bacilli bacterium]|nr:MvaI/BcnI family restriction endonuclease [Bacilli bacterium]
MYNNIDDLKSKFDIISKQGWIKSKYYGTGSGGQTFEYLLNKPIENFEIPDYEGIEIKTKNAIINKYITMFNATPDSAYEIGIKRIKDTYGYPDKKLNNTKVFNISIFSNTTVTIGGKYFFKLKICQNERKIFMYVFDKDMFLIEKTIFWSFDLLEEKLQRKLQTLAIINTSYKKEGNIVYYKYDDISFYKLRSFDHFISAIEKNFIRVTFKIGTFKSGKRIGQIHDHGTSFDIHIDNLNCLYEIIET